MKSEQSFHVLTVPIKILTSNGWKNFEFPFQINNGFYNGIHVAGTRAGFKFEDSWSNDLWT